MADDYPGGQTGTGAPLGAPTGPGQPGRTSQGAPPPTWIQIEDLKAKVAARIKDAQGKIGDADRALKASAGTLAKSVGQIVVEYGGKVDGFGTDFAEQLEKQDCKAKALKPKVDAAAIDAKIGKYDAETWTLYHAIERWGAQLESATRTLATDLDSASANEVVLRTTQDRARRVHDRIGRLKDLVKQIEVFEGEQRWAKAWFLVREHNRTIEEIRDFGAGDRMVPPDRFEDELKTVVKACNEATEKLRHTKYGCEQALAKLTTGVDALAKRMDERQQTLLTLVQV